MGGSEIWTSSGFHRLCAELGVKDERGSLGSQIAQWSHAGARVRTKAGPNISGERGVGLAWQRVTVEKEAVEVEGAGLHNIRGLQCDPEPNLS